MSHVLRKPLHTLSLCAALSAGSSVMAMGAKPPATTPTTPTVPTNPTLPTTPTQPTIPTTPSPQPNASIDDVTSDIIKLSANTSCANYNWKSRGRAPAGFANGIALTYAKSICRGRAGDASGQLMASKSSGLSRDSLTFFEPVFDAKKMAIDVSGNETLRSLFVLGMGEAMMESSGNYCEGYDVAGQAAKTGSASGAESGLFQTSYDSISAAPSGSAELKALYAEYKADSSRCFPDTFKKGASCSARKFLGTGEGLTFQTLEKNCPAFATEFAMLTFRVERTHYGPLLKTTGTEVAPVCDEMLSQVQDYVERNAASVCSTLLND